MISLRCILVLSGKKLARVDYAIQKVGRNYRIVSNKLTAYYAEYGNGGRGTYIYPKRAKALRITNGVNRTLGWAKYVHGYDGTGFIHDVAERHR